MVTNGSLGLRLGLWGQAMAEVKVLTNSGEVCSIARVERDNCSPIP
jgi:hypothetical protein